MSNSVKDGWLIAKLGNQRLQKHTMQWRYTSEFGIVLLGIVKIRIAKIGIVKIGIVILGILKIRINILNNW